MPDTGCSILDFEIEVNLEFEIWNLTLQGFKK
jgi:hypothetical protein